VFLITSLNSINFWSRIKDRSSSLR
jgi:hypothetical protein